MNFSKDIKYIIKEYNNYKILKLKFSSGYLKKNTYNYTFSKPIVYKTIKQEANITLPNFLKLYKQKNKQQLKFKIIKIP